MNITELLTRLQEIGVELKVDQQKLVCKGPKGALTPELADAIRANKPALIDLVPHARSQENVSEAIPVVPEGKRLRLTTAQESLVFRQQLIPGSPFLTLPGAWHLRGALDVDRLKKAINAFCDRHAVVRATITLDEAGSRFVVGDHAELEIPIVEFEQSDDQHSRVISYLEENGKTYLDFESGPMFRCELLKLASDHYVLFIMANHLVWDGWSFDIFLEELDASYSQRAGDKNVDASQPKIQYMDYAEWHRDWVERDQVLEKIRAVAGSLEDYSKHFEVPTDYRRPTKFSHSGCTVGFEIMQELCSKLHAQCSLYRVTPYMMLVAVLNFVLFRFSRQNDIAIGSHIQNRTRAELDNLVGFFVNSSVIRTQVDEDATFADLLRAARKSCLNALENRQVPIDALIRKLAIPPDPSNLPLVQAFFSYQDMQDRPDMIGDISCRSVIRKCKTTDADLTLWLRNYGDRLDGGFDYRTDLYDERTMQSLRASFELALETVLNDPDVSLSSIPLVTTQDRESYVAEWVRTGEELPSASVYGLIKRQIDRVPTNTAISFGTDSLTYQEFGDRVKQLSGALVADGIRQGDVVGVNLSRSIDLVVTLTAILRLGAVYLPLDPKLPSERLRFINSDANAQIVIAESSDRQNWHMDEARVLDINDTNVAEIETGEVPQMLESGENIAAYMIYTSGSTGKPKGVVVSQENVVNFLTSMAEVPGMQETDRLLAVTTCSFDISVLEFFLPLVVGAEVVVASDEETRDAASLAQIISTRNITVFQSTPATWRMLVGSGWEGSEVLKALCGGEALSSELAQSLRPLVSSLYNMYGPTETTVWSAVSELQSEIPERIPLGKPIRNTELYVLDAAMNVVPQGAVGELFIGGKGVTMGYHNRPELTDSRFVTSPFDDEVVLYATGDLVRIGGSGELEFQGRIDDQIKVRGYRIELGEIENALQGLDKVAQAAVTLRKYSDDDHRLLAFVVASSSETFSVGQLRKELRKVLPDYMIPQHLTQVDSLPLSPAGKVDRNALPDIDLANRRSQRELPTTVAEKRLAEIWMKAIGVAQVDRRDRFFELGGHSLLAMQVILEIEKDLGRKVSAGSLMMDNLQQVASELGLEDMESAAATDGQSKASEGRGGALHALRSLIGQ